jgi:hypothetical protein
VEVERDAALVAAGDLEPQAVAVLRLAHLAQRVAVRVLDLDDIGAEVGEHHGGQRPREHRRAVDHLEPGERAVTLRVMLHWCRPFANRSLRHRRC